MKKRRIQSKLRYLLAFLIATLVFIDGFMLVYSFSYLEYQRISEIQGELSYQLFQNKLKHYLFDEDLCSADLLVEISEDLGYQGKIIDDLERKLGKNDQRVLFRKKFYTLMQLEHFEFVRRINKECEEKIPTILFFYSNEDLDLKKSEELGELLGVVYRREPDLKIYSFDINLDSDLINRLKMKYNVNEPLTILINEDTKLMNPKGVDEIEQYL
jgi:hypothetical protein